MEKVKKREIEKIKKMVEKDFPDDPALQQVHIARKVLSREAEIAGLSFTEYIKLMQKRVKGMP
jgi:hypothetical protein